MPDEGEAPQKDLPVVPLVRRETPIPPPVIPHLQSSLPQKRVLVEDDHTPAVRSPLNPEAKPAKAQTPVPVPSIPTPSPAPVPSTAPAKSATPTPVPVLDETPSMAREKRTKKESLKKRESKGALAGVDSTRATPEPRRREPKAGGEFLPMRYKLNGPVKPSDFDQAQGPIFRPHHEVQGPRGETLEFFEPSEQPVNRRGYVYEYGIADPKFPSSLYYRQTDTKPFHAHLSFEDAASSIYFDKSGLHVTGEYGFRMARANVAAREGRWYWECKITRGCIKDRKDAEPESHGHVRMGFARREASRDAPVGYDAYSYGLRDVAGQKVHMSRPKDLFPPGEDIAEGDVVGLEIQLPSEYLHRKVVQGSYNPAVDKDDDEVVSSTEGPSIVRDRIPFRFQTSKLCFEKFDYYPIKELEDLMNPAPMASGPAGSNEAPNPNHVVPCLRTLPNSYIKVYKNGVLKGTPYTDLLAFLPPASSANSKMQEGAREKLDDGTLGYYPAVSVYRGGAAEVNFGPNFWFPPPELECPAEDVDMVDVGTAERKPELQQRLTKLRAAGERYDEQIVEDIVYDIIDEVHFWMQDGGRVVDRVENGITLESSRNRGMAMED